MRLAAALCALVPAAFCQSAPAPPAFEVASVKPSLIGAGEKGGGDGPRNGWVSSPGSVTARRVSLAACVQWAYELRDFQISGPAWIGSERYDIVAKAAGPAAETEMRAMMQTLLAERFKMVVHRETKEIPVYELMVAKNGPKLRHSETEGKPNIRPSGGGFVVQNASMSELADGLSRLRMTPRPMLDRPVLDRTGLTGQYDFSVQLFDTPEGFKEAMRSGDIGASIFSLITEQLGLKLEPKKHQMAVLVIDSAEKIPAEN